MSAELDDLYFRGFRMDRRGRRLFELPGGARVALSVGDFNVLETLLVHAGTVVCAPGRLGTDPGHIVRLKMGKPSLEQVIGRLRDALRDPRPSARKEAGAENLPPPIIHTVTPGYLVERDDVSTQPTAPAVISAVDLHGGAPAVPAGGEAASHIGAYKNLIAEHVRHVYLLGTATPYALSDVFVPTAVVGHRRQGLHPEIVSKHDPVMRYLARAQMLGRDVAGGESTSKQDKVGSPLTIDEYTQAGVHAVITGAMGVGKSTLLRHVAAKVLAEGRTPVFLELGAIAADDWRRHTPTSAGFLRLLLERSASGLELGAADAEELFREIERQASLGQVVVLLDGLDELAPTPFYDDLRRSIEEFARSRLSAAALLVSCRSQALHARPLRGLTELEVQLLDEHGIDEFLSGYFGSSPETIDAFLDDLRGQPGLYDMASVPTLLGTIFDLWRSPETTKFTSKLAIYRDIVRRLVLTIHQEKGAPRGFRVNDQDGLRRRAFLRELAASRLLAKETASRHARPYVFTDLEIRERAVLFAQQCAVDADAFVTDIVHTAALREISDGIYAFAHPSLQEYLAAEALADSANPVQRIADIAFDPAIANTEMLPMALALTTRQREGFEHLAGLPESIDWILLRIRLKALGYMTGQSPEFGIRVYEAFGAALRSCRSPWALLNDAAIVTGDARRRIVERVRSVLVAGLERARTTDAISIAIFAVGFLRAKELVPLLKPFYSSHEHGRYIPTVLSWFEDVDIRRHLLAETVVNSFAPPLDDRVVRWAFRGYPAEIYSEQDNNVASVPLAESLRRAAWRGDRRRRGQSNMAVVDDLVVLLEHLEVHQSLWLVFRSAVAVMTSTKREQLLERLVEAATNDSTVPAPVTEALAIVGGRRAADVLLARFGDEHVAIGAATFTFLATTYPAEARKAAEAGLVTGSEDVRERAHLLLRSIVDPGESLHPGTFADDAPSVQAMSAETDTSADPVPEFDVLGPSAHDEEDQLLGILESGVAFSTNAAVVLGQRGKSCVASCLTEGSGADAYDRAVLLLAALTSPLALAREQALRVVASNQDIIIRLCASVAELDRSRANRPEPQGLRQFAAALRRHDLGSAVQRTVSDSRWRMVSNAVLRRSRGWAEHARHWMWLLEKPLAEIGAYLWERGALKPQQALAVVADAPEIASVRTARVLLDIATLADAETAERARLAFRRVPAGAASEVLTEAARSALERVTATALLCLIDREDADNITEPVFELLALSENDDFGVRETALENLVTLASARQELTSRVLTMALRRAQPYQVRRAAMRVAGYYLSIGDALDALKELGRETDEELSVAARELTQRLSLRFPPHS